MITGADVLAYLKAQDNPDVGSGGLAQLCADSAMELVSIYVGAAVVPESVLFSAELVVAVEMFSQRNAPSGILANAGSEGGMRIARNPMTGAYSRLAPYMSPGIA